MTDMLDARAAVAGLPELWDHQRRGIRFAAERRAAMFHVVMGGGKSRMAIETVREWGVTTTLVIGPLSVVRDGWGKQFRIFDPEARFLRLHKGTVAAKARRAEELVQRCQAAGERAVVAVNYESAWREPFASWVLRAAPDALVLDESHKVKSPSGRASRWVARAARRSGRVLLLTGTPMPHSPLDIWAQMRAMAPGVLGSSYVRFRGRYAVMGGFQNRQVLRFQRLDELRARIAPYVFQMTDVERLNLPPVRHIVRTVEMPPAAAKIYGQMEKECIAYIGEEEVTAANALVALLRLQQITSGFLPIEDGARQERVHAAKLQDLTEILESLEADEPVVVFGKFRGDLDHVHEAARELGRESLELSGRRNELEAWQGGRAPVLAVQIQAGGVGVDLSRAAYCVYLSTGFNLGDYLQSLARTHRPGQRRPVTYYHLVALGTIDEVTRHALASRERLVSETLANLAAASASFAEDVVEATVAN